MPTDKKIEDYLHLYYSGDVAEIAHHCSCNSVERCKIFIHPSEEVQHLLNQLMDAMAKFDDSAKSKSTLIFQSIHPDGTFTSVTKQK